MNASRHHYENSVLIPETCEKVFALINDHKRFSSHMSQSSWMMAGSKMDILLDDKKGQAVGSHIKLIGTFLGMHLFLDEVVVTLEPPHLKVWETVGPLQLIIIGDYQLKVEVKPHKEASLLSVAINYELPKTHVWLGRLFGALYARWCVQQMLNGTSNYFSNNKRR